MLECVVNVSEGRQADVVAELAAAGGAALLDVHADPDHHRSVFTLAGSAGDVEAAALGLARVACRQLDISGHRGVHPRLGAVDVVPFVALEDADRPLAVATAQRFAATVADELSVPVFLYGDADPEGRSLPDLRRAAFRGRAPDFGPAAPHPTMGAIAVGARDVLVAVNCELAEGADLATAREIAGGVRERDGGLPGVRALGFWLASRGRAQVSMNLVDLAVTGLEAACGEVRRQARERGTDVAAVELVGLLPAAELTRCRTEFRAWAGIGPDQTIEAQLLAAGRV